MANEKQKSAVQQLQETLSEDFMTLIYDKVNSLLGAGNQLFAMEFPARPLNPKTYEYAVDNCYSVLTKPYPVQEAEFLLSDQMFDVSPIVQGSNGERVSTVYSTVINNLVPKLEGLKGFVNDQKNLRNWLLENVSDDGRTMSRMALSKELYGDFLEKRNDWYSKKNDAYDDRKHNDDLEGYSRWVTSEGLVREEQVNNSYNDAIVRGNYHEVLTLLGFLNVSSPSEALEVTKQKMRASLRRSLDGSTDIYPVQFQPSDWFKSLRPNLSPKDLTMATESLVAEYRAKQSKLHSLQSLYAEQSVVEIDPAEQQKLEAEITRKQDELSKSEKELIAQYGSGAVSAVRTVIDIYKTVKGTGDAIKNASAKDEASRNTEEKNIAKIVGDIAPNVVDGILNSFSAQQKSLDDMKKLNEARMAFAEAKVKDMRLQKLRIQEQIDSVQADLDFLRPLVTGAISESKKPEATEEPELLTPPAEEPEDSNFMDVIISTEDIINMSSNKSESSSSQSSFKAGFWFASGGTQRSQSQASQEQKKKALEKKVEIGFRIKKVSLDRGGWFNPNLFKLSNNFYRLADIRFSRGLTKDDLFKVMEAGENAGKELKKLVTYDAEDGSGKKMEYVLSAYPSSFVIAKDITIRIQTKDEETELNNQYMESSKSSSGGFLGFRGGSSSSSKSQSESAYFGSSHGFFYIRIPGPQILGWFLEFTPGDNTDPYKELDPELYSAALKELLPEPVKETDIQSETNRGE